MGTIPVPYTPVAGDDATQARVLTWADAANYLLGNATSGGSKRPFAYMRQTVAQSIPTGVDTAVLLDTENVDYDNGHSTVTNTDRYTAQTAGWHEIRAQVSIVTGAGSSRQFFFNVNGANTTSGGYSAAPAGVATVVSLSMTVFLSVGDFVQLMINQNSGGALNTVVSSPFQASMTVQWRSN